jgi:hypothetical protein
MSQFIFPPLTASLDSEQSSGGALPSRQMIVGGYHAGGSKVYPLAVDADGQLQVDVISSMPLPSGAATSALQTAGNNILTTIDADTSSLAGAVSGSELQVDVVASLPTGSNQIGKLAANSGVDIGDVDVLSSALPTGAATSALQTSSEAILTTIDADTGTLAGAVSGTEMQVDVITSALPSGAATSALQTSSEAILTTIDADTGSLAGCVSGTELQVDVVSGSVTVVNSMTPIDFLNAGVFDASTGTNIPTAGSAVLVTMAADCKEIEVIDDIGEYMSLRLTDGTVKAYLPLGGGRVKCHLSTGNEMKLYSETGTTINSGKIAMNFLA